MWQKADSGFVKKLLLDRRQFRHSGQSGKLQCHDLHQKKPFTFHYESGGCKTVDALKFFSPRNTDLFQCQYKIYCRVPQTQYNRSDQSSDAPHEVSLYTSMFNKSLIDRMNCFIKGELADTFAKQQTKQKERNFFSKLPRKLANCVQKRVLEF